MINIDKFVRTVNEKGIYVVYLDPQTALPGDILEIYRGLDKQKAILKGNKLKTTLQKVVENATGKAAISPISDVGLR